MLFSDLQFTQHSRNFNRERLRLQLIYKVVISGLTKTLMCSTESLSQLLIFIVNKPFVVYRCRPMLKFGDQTMLDQTDEMKCIYVVY